MSFPQVPIYKDGDDLDANNMNEPIRALTARTDYAKQRLDEILGADINASTMYSGSFEVGVAAGAPVFFNNTTNLHANASANITSEQVSNYQFAASSAYVLGIKNNTNHVVTSGKFVYSSLSNIPLATGEEYRSGPYYLSAEAGKITATPKGVAILLGNIHLEEGSYTFHISINVKDLWESHLHTEYILSNETAGVHSITGGIHVIDGYQDDAATADETTLLVKGNTDEEITLTVSGSDVTTAVLTVATEDYSIDVPIGNYYKWIPTGAGTLAVMLSPHNAGTAAITSGLAWTINKERCVGWRRHIESHDAVTTSANATDIYLIGTAVEGDITILATAANEVTVTVDGTGHNVVVANNTSVWVVDDLYIRVSNLEAFTAGQLWTVYFQDEGPGAKFVYNIEADSTFANNYPTTPTNNLTLDLNGVNLLSRKAGSVIGIYSAGFYGIYWYNNEEGKAPLPVDELEHNQRILRAYTTYTRVGDAGIVTSLRAGDSMVSLRKQGVDVPAGSPATGDLEIVADFNIQTNEGDESGYKVIKKIEGGKAFVGPVVENITSNNGTMSITNIDGSVNIDLASATGVKGTFDDSILLNARHTVDENGMFPYIELLPYMDTSDPETGVLYKMTVPYSLMGTYSLSMYLSVFGDTSTASTQSAPLDISVGILPDYYQGTGTIPTTPKSISDAEITNLNASPIMFTDYTAKDPFIYHNDPELTITPKVTTVPFAGRIGSFTLTRGDVVTIRIKRAVGGTYQGSLGILTSSWGLVKDGS